MEYEHGGDIYTNKEMLDFSVNVNPFGPNPAVVKAAQESMEQIGQYPDSECRELRGALAKHLALPGDCMIFGNGAAELIFLLVKAERPKKALLTIPSFAEYRRALETVGCEIVGYPLSGEARPPGPGLNYGMPSGYPLSGEARPPESGLDCGMPSGYPLSGRNDFQLTEEYLSMLTDDLDLIFLCSPDNPSGAVIPKELLLQILEICEQKKIRMVLDECFLDFLSDAEDRTLKDKVLCAKELFLLRAFTKIHAIPGIRLGYGLCGDHALLQKMERNRQPWSVSLAAQAAGVAALKELQWVKVTRKWIVEERKWLEKQLQEIGIFYFPGKANYLLLKSEKDLYSLCKAHKILIRDCKNYVGLGPGYFRIAVRKREENERLVQVLRKIYGGE